MRISRIVAAAFLAIAAVPALTQGPAPLTPAPSPSTTKAILPATAVPTGGAPLDRADAEAWLDGFMPFALARSDIAGAVVVVVKDGQVLVQKGYGFSDVAARKPVSAETTLFRPGSISKLFTWTAVMQLVEQGKLDLDRDVNDYLDFKIPPFEGKPITLRNIMTHTAGFEESVRYLITDDPKGALPLATYVKKALPKRVFAPGTTPAYSNYATAVAGYIVARTSGMSFDDYIEQHVMWPLGMRHSTFRQPLPAQLQPFMSKGYQVASQDAKPFEFVVPAPAGSLSASGADMGKFMVAHLAEGRGLLRPETSRMMRETKLTIVPPLNRMALGFYEKDINGHTVVGHGGDTEHFHSDLALFTGDNVGLYVSVNSAGSMGAAHVLRSALLEQFADRYFPAPRASARVDAATARKHAEMMAGTYTSSRGGFTSFLRVLDLLGQAKVGVDKDGGLLVPSVTGPANQPRKWVEIAPFVWRDVASGERLAAKVENGRIDRWSFDTVSAFTVFDRTPWYLDGAWLMPMLLASLGVVALTALAWPAGAISRRRYKARAPLEGRAWRVQRLTYGFAWAAFVVLVGWATFISVGFASLRLLAGPLDWLLWTLQILSPLVFLGLVGLAGWNLALVWRGGRGWFAKLWSVLLLIAAIMLLWVALGFNLIGFGTVY